MTIQPTTREFAGHFPRMQETGETGKCAGCAEESTRLIVVPRLTGTKRLCPGCVNELARMFQLALDEHNYDRHRFGAEK